jgi:ribosomal protein S18 acetylase RimI-like enzyme
VKGNTGDSISEEQFRFGSWGERRAITKVAASAMQHDPLMAAFVPNPEKRAAVLRAILGLMVRDAILKGELFTANDSLDCFAILQTDGRLNPFQSLFLVPQGISILVHAGIHSIRTMLHFWSFSRSLHSELVPVPHAYLALIAVDPSHQGKGLGNSLLQFLTSKASALGLPIYLETHNRQNVIFYQHFGFTVAKELAIPLLGIRQWCMIKS